MIIVKISNGLGNQMFQYAFARYMQLYSGHRIYLDIHDINYKETAGVLGIMEWMKLCDERKYGLDAFQIKVPIIEAEKCRKFQRKTKSGKFWKYLELFQLCPNIFLSEKECKIEDVTFHKYQNYYISGSFISGKWIFGRKNFICILQKDFQLRKGLNFDLWKKIEWGDIFNREETVSVHIRRGDFLNVGRDISQGSYYKRAVEAITKKIKSPYYIVFSDDIAWVKKNYFFGRCLFVSGCGLSDPEEMVLMSRCRHHIIANSTFSYWGALINTGIEKLVIYPRGWRKRIMPDNWVPV